MDFKNDTSSSSSSTRDLGARVSRMFFWLSASRSNLGSTSAWIMTFRRREMMASMAWRSLLRL